MHSDDYIVFNNSYLKENLSRPDQRAFMIEDYSDISEIFTPSINDYINSNEDIEQDYINEQIFSENMRDDFYKENILEFEKNIPKEDIKKEKPYIIPYFENSPNSMILLNNSKISDISFYDNDLDKTIQNLAKFDNKDYSSFSNKKRRRSSKYKKDLSKINNNESKKLNNSDDIICRKNNQIFFSTKKTYNKIFKIENNYKRGRKSLKSGLSGKHNKYCFDNISKRLKSWSFDYIREELNSKLEKLDNSELINYKFLKFNAQQANNSAKEYNRNLMNKTFKEIFSEKISGKYNYEEDYNKKLLDKIYKLDKKQKDEKIDGLINLLDMKYKDFWDSISKYLKAKDKENYLNNDDGKCCFFKELIKNFIFRVDENLDKKKLDEKYKTIFKLILGNFPQKFL